MFSLRFKQLRNYIVGSTTCLALWVCSSGAAAEPGGAEPIYDPNLQQVQLPPVPPIQPAPIVQPPPPPRPFQGPGGVTPTDVGGLRPADALPPDASRAGTGVVAGGGAAENAPDVGSLLSNSAAAIGVGVQQRNAITGEARVRGYRVGQVVTYGYNSFFFPARQDLDSAVSKFDAGSISDVVIIKGPYSVRYGPGFSFLDIGTFDSPRNEDGFHAKGRTSAGYATNGEGVTFLQSAEGGAEDWGFRIGYDLRVGNDYRAGDGRFVPSSYNSENVTYALGFDLGEKAKIELKGMRLYQHDVEFAGSYFDIKRLDTEAYNVRLTAIDSALFDRLTFDVWYNYTGAKGNTLQGAKQALLNPLLTNSFFPVNPNDINSINQNRFIQDASQTTFGESSRGYRLATTWGTDNCTRLTVGTDLNYVGQRLNEYIRLQQFGSGNPPTFPLPDPTLAGNDPLIRQDLGIPQCHYVDPGIFADVTIPLDKRWTLTAGARADYVYATSKARFVGGNVFLLPGNQFNPRIPGQIPGSGGTGQPVTGFDPIVFSTQPFNTDLNRNFDLFSFYGTADYKIDDHLTAFVKAGWGQRAPTLTELYAAGPFLALLQQGLNRTVGDPHLDSETNRQFDIGIVGSYTNVRFGANGFYAWINDYITFDLVRGGNPATTQVVFTNTDEATLAGGELYAEVDLTERVTPFTTISYVQGRDLTHVDTARPGNIASSRRAVTVDTEPLPGIVPLELRSGFRLHDSGDRPDWSIEFAARSVMGQNLVAASLNEQPTAGFTTFDVRAYWQVSEGVLLTGGVENIGDKFYREHLDSRAGDQLFRRGRNFYVSAEMKY